MISKNIYVAKATSNTNFYQSAKADCNGLFLSNV